MQKNKTNINHFPLRRIQLGLILAVGGFLILMVGTRPDLFLLDRSPVLGFVQVAVMLVGLAAICVGGYICLIGLWKGRSPSIAAELGERIISTGYIIAVFAGLADITLLGQVNTELVATIGANLALGSRLFLAIIFLVVFCRKLLYRGKEITAGPTWGCGFTRPTARMQYTGTSYARSVVDFFRPFVLIRETEVRLLKIFPKRTAYTSRVDDIAEAAMNYGLAFPLLAMLRKLRWIQHGNVQLYIGYIIVAILVLLLVLFI